MERIQKALELARAERAAAAGPDVAAVEPIVVPLASALNDGSARRAGTRAPEPERLPVDLAGWRARHLVPPDERSSAAHAYRVLRSQLLGWLRGTTHRVVGVVSASDGEGKSLTAANLALALAGQVGPQVTLIDLDLRRPSIGALFGVPRGRVGVEAFLSGSAQIDEIGVSFAGMDRLRILPATGPVANGPDLLGSPAARQLVDSACASPGQPLVIIDMAPVLLSTDFMTLSPLLDGVLVVATEGRTRRDDLQRMNELLRRVRVIGGVLNMASDFERRAY